MKFQDQPDYVLRWPATLFEAELRRLLDDPDALEPDERLEDAVEWLFRQAFVDATVPLRHFQQNRDWHDPYEEPF